MRSENERNVTRMAARQPGGVPGVSANTPPPEANLLDGPPQADTPQGEGQPQAETSASAAIPSDRETAVQRAYELDREVAVPARRAGGLTKLSVAVAVNQEAMVAAAPLTPEELEALVSAAVGADDARGDMVKIAVSAFESREIAPLEFYEEGWFAMAVRYGTALLAVLLVLLLAVRPLIARTKTKGAKSSKKADGKDDVTALGSPDDDALALEAGAAGAAGGAGPSPNRADAFENLPEQVRLARTLASEQPDRALEALQRMLKPASEEPEGATS